MCYMVGFGIGAAIGLKEITSYQATQWGFGNFFVPYGIPKIIVVDTYVISARMFKKTLQETLLIPEHAFSKVNHKAIIN